MSRAARDVVRIEIEHWFDVSVREGFDYITDPANWPEYWPRFVRIDPNSRWRQAGDRARITFRMLAREVELQMELCRLERWRLVEYRSEQRALPPTRHGRHFDEARGGLLYRIVIEYRPRPGWRGLLDRTVVRHATTRTARMTMANLERRFRDRSPPPMVPQDSA